MVTIGVDAHKRVHQAVALDPTGRVLGSWRGANTPEHWQELLNWAARWPGPRQWGVEGAWNYGRGLAQCLVAQGETVYEINPRWTAKQRRRARTPGKRDPLDAHAVATLVQAEAATLPPVTAEDETAVLDLLVTERTDVAGRGHTAAQPAPSAGAAGRSRLHHPPPAAPQRGGRPRRGGLCHREEQPARAAPRRGDWAPGAALAAGAGPCGSLGTADLRACGAAVCPADALARRAVADGGGLGGHLGARPALSVGGAAGGLRRCRAAGGLLGRVCAPPAQSRRQSPTERHAVSHRADAGT